MIIIAGLGNPGTKYERTRHNLGYLVLDEIFDGWGVKRYRRRFSSLIAKHRIGKEKVLLMKPLTYMNDSGRAIKRAAAHYRVDKKDIFIIYDDIDLPVGELRIRKKGGPGTHNGMRSIVGSLGGEDFPRIRIGVGRPENKDELVDYVLGKPKADEWGILRKAIHDAADAAKACVANGIEDTMQRYNNR